MSLQIIENISYIFFIEEFLVFCMKTSKQKRGQISMKDLISKLYFSRTQENYMKIYGSDGKYKEELAQLIPKINRKKLNKIVEQVKENNFVFRKYLQKERISRLTVEDVNSFEDKIEAQGRKTLSHFSHRSNENHKQLDNDIIRIGFMMILQKLNHEISDNFITETKYLKETIQRENENLNRFGYEYLGTKCEKLERNIIEDLNLEEQRNGKFKLIGNKIREQTQIIENVESFLRNITLKANRQVLQTEFQNRLA